MIRFVCSTIRVFPINAVIKVFSEKTLLINNQMLTVCAIIKFVFLFFFGQSFNGDEFLKCLVELIKVEQEWVPREDNCSLYIRPTFIGTGVCLLHPCIIVA